MRVRLGLTAAVSLLLCSGALADSVFVGTLERKDVKIINFRNGVVEFSISGRPVDPVPADRITRLVIDDDPAFTKAEQYFAEGNYLAAADGYQAVLKTASKPWMKDWILPRQLQATDRAGRIDLAAFAFIQLTQKDLNAALRHRPIIAENADAQQLSAAAAELKKAAAANTANLAAKQAILSMLLDVSRAQGDLAGASAVADQLLKSIPADKSDPVVVRLLGDVNLGIAKLALAQKDYAKAVSQIESNRELFSEPASQADALYTLARARDEQAASDSTPDSLKDRALGYMRAVALARQTPTKAHIPECLMRVAAIQEQLGDLKSASALYAELVSEYKDNPVAAKAAQEQQRLKEKTGL